MKMWEKFKLRYNDTLYLSKYFNKRTVKFVIFILIGLFLLHICQTIYFITFAFFPENISHRRSILLDQLQLESRPQTNHHIPKIVHQMWIGGKPLPSRMHKSIKSWKSQSHLFQYMLWNDTTIHQFLNKNYPWIVDLYNSYPYTINRCDMIRYVILFHYGGIYADLEFYCPKRIEDFFRIMKNAEVGLVQGAKYGFNGHYMIAAKRTHFMKYAILDLYNFRRWYYTPHLDIILNAGPLFVTSQYNQYPFKEHILSIKEKFLFNRCQSLGGGTWYGWDTKIAYFIEDHLNDFTNVFLTLTIFVLIFICFRLYRKYSSRR